jgi:hypothetical protein
VTEAAAGPFSRTTLVAVIGVAIVSLVVAIVLTVVGGDPGGGSAGADAYSKSAIGYRGLVELLDKLDVPVVVSRNASAEKAAHGLLVIAEPKIGDSDAKQRLAELVHGAPRVLVILPKWYGFAWHGDPWVDSVERVSREDVQEVLRVLDTDEIAADDKFRIIATAAPPLTFVDADIANNAGLRNPDNARDVVALIDSLRAGGPVVFDEITHGHGEPPSLMRVLFRFPLVLATLQLALCALLAAWAAMVRFGPRRAAPPPLAPGKDFLVRNTAALLRFGGHDREAVQRYLAHAVATVRHALHAPDNLSHVALVAWLDRVAAARGLSASLAELEEDVAAAPRSPHKVIELADAVHRWREEMMHGAQRRS